MRCRRCDVSGAETFQFCAQLPRTSGRAGRGYYGA